jgi:hypothetical protein
LGVG